MSTPRFQFITRDCRPYEAEGEVADLYGKHYPAPNQIPDRINFAHQIGGRLVTASNPDGKLVGFFLYGPQFHRPFPEFEAAQKPAYIIYHAVEKENLGTISFVEPFLFRCFLEDIHKSGFDHFLFDVWKRNTTAFGLYEHFVRNKWATKIGETEDKAFYAAPLDITMRDTMKFAHLANKLGVIQNG